MNESVEFEGWAIVELMGHRRIGAYVREVELAGTPVLRLDIPENENVDDIPEVLQGTPPADVNATQFYPASALYCLTPTTEAMARAVAAKSRPTPVHAWELPRQPALAAGAADHGEDDPFDEREGLH